MLILQRKEKESLLINNDIKISILDIGSNWVKLGIDAPKDVKITRYELAEAENANKEAVSPAPASLKQIKDFLR